MTSVSGSVTSRSGYRVGAMAWLQFKHSTGFEAGRKKSLPGGTGSKSTYQILIQLPGASRWLVTGYTSRKHIYITSTGLPRRTGGSTLVKSSWVHSETPVPMSVKEAAIADPVILQPRRHRRYRNPGSVAISP